MDSENNPGNPWLEVQPYVDTILAVQDGKMIKMIRCELTDEHARFESSEINMRKPAVLFLYIGHLGEIRQRVSELFARPIVKSAGNKLINVILSNHYKPERGEMTTLPEPTECLVTFSEYTAQTLNVTQHLRLDHLNIDKNKLTPKDIDGLRDRGVDPKADFHFTKKLNIDLPSTDRATEIINKDMAIVSIFQECHVRQLTWYSK